MTSRYFFVLLIDSILRDSVPQINIEEPKDITTWSKPVGIGNTRILTNYAQKFPHTAGND